MRTDFDQTRPIDAQRDRSIVVAGAARSNVDLVRLDRHGRPIRESAGRSQLQGLARAGRHPAIGSRLDLFRPIFFREEQQHGRRRNRNPRTDPRRPHESTGPAGMSKFVDVLGLDIGYVREKLHMLRREGLVKNMGRTGHIISKKGKEYLESRCL